MTTPPSSKGGSAHNLEHYSALPLVVAAMDAPIRVRFRLCSRWGPSPTCYRGNVEGNGVSKPRERSICPMATGPVGFRPPPPNPRADVANTAVLAQRLRSSLRPLLARVEAAPERKVKIHPLYAPFRFDMNERTARGIKRKLLLVDGAQIP
jgi:hypothetical protein